MKLWTCMSFCYKWHNSLERFYGIGNKRNDSKGDKFCFSIQKIQKVKSLKTISKIMMINFKKMDNPQMFTPCLICTCTNIQSSVFYNDVYDDKPYTVHEHVYA